MKQFLVERFLLWIVCFALLADGLVGVITLTIFRPYWSLRAEQWYLDYPRPIDPQEPSANTGQAEIREEYEL